MSTNTDTPEGTLNGLRSEVAQTHREFDEMKSQRDKALAELTAAKATIADLRRDISELRGDGENSRPTWSELRDNLGLQKFALAQQSEVLQHLVPRTVAEQMATALEEAQMHLGYISHNGCKSCLESATKSRLSTQQHAAQCFIHQFIAKTAVVLAAYAATKAQ